MNESDEPRNVSAVSDETLVNNGLNALFYSQSMTVTEALDAAEPAPDGTRLAETIPNGDVVAVKTPAGVYVRRKNKKTGHGSSELLSGYWFTLESAGGSQAREELLPWRSWRPI